MSRAAIETIYHAYHHVVVRDAGIELRVHVPGDHSRAQAVAAACDEAVRLIEDCLRRCHGAPAPAAT